LSILNNNIGAIQMSKTDQKILWCIAAFLALMGIVIARIIAGSWTEVFIGALCLAVTLSPFAGGFESEVNASAQKKAMKSKDEEIARLRDQLSTAQSSETT
jgi:hypothetical protein